MAIDNKTSTHVNPACVDFEPYCEWQKDAGNETLVLRLPDFKKDQLRVQMNTKGVLKISGENPEKKRFLKETKAPQGCDINDIKAKFSNGFLYITLPKKPEETEKTKKTEDSVSGAEQKNRRDSENDDRRSTMVKLYEDNKKVVVGFGVAFVVIVAIGAFVACKYGGSDSSQIVDEAKEH